MSDQKALLRIIIAHDGRVYDSGEHNVSQTEDFSVEGLQKHLMFAAGKIMGRLTEDMKARQKRLERMQGK